MLISVRHRCQKKLPILLLVFLLCVQSIGYASHGLLVEKTISTEVAEQSLPSCHDMPEMQAAQPQDSADHAMPCCDDGQCADAHCMMPAGTHFDIVLQDYFLALDDDALIAFNQSIHSTKPSPPLRPPIA